MTLIMNAMNVMANVALREVLRKAGSMMMKTLESGSDDLGIEDSGGQLNGPHYGVCVCGPDSRRYLISWLPRAQLSLSKELFQLESPPPTLALVKLHISRLYYMKQDTLDFSRQINQAVRTLSGVLEIQPFEKEKKGGKERCTDPFSCDL